MYKLINDDEGNLDGIFVLETKSMIPVDPDNYDYQDYLEWVAEGNTPEEADPAPE